STDEKRKEGKREVAGKQAKVNHPSPPSSNKTTAYLSSPRTMALMWSHWIS
ncbi:hypothetical protein OUZ56_024614, partial [Daphnia magna]